MKNGFKTIASIKKDCIDFADKVLAANYSDMDDDTLCVTADQAREPIEIAATVTETIFRKTGLKLFSCQLETAFALYNGHIAELSTGEGKTLAGVVAALMIILQSVMQPRINAFMIFAVFRLVILPRILRFQSVRSSMKRTFYIFRHVKRDTIVYAILLHIVKTSLPAENMTLPLLMRLTLF